MPVNGKPNGRFELPAFTPLNFSLTDGTDIPPPPDSPIEVDRPVTPTPATPTPNAAITVKVPAPEPLQNGQNGHSATITGGEYDGRGRTTYQPPPMSPASSKRPSSIRRFLSRKSLNTNYEDGPGHNLSKEDLMMMDRPESAMSFASRPSLKKKKSGSWFRRLGSSGGSHRTSVIYEEKKVVPMGPPPPKLPELNQLKAKIPENDNGAFGGEDLFKNIK